MAFYILNNILMNITWIGHSCFKIDEKINGENVSLLTDPFSSDTGLKLPNLSPDLVSVSHQHHDHNNISSLRGKPIIIDSAGEFDIKGVMIEGIRSYHDEEKGAKRGENIIFRFDIEGMSLAHLGDLGELLDNKQLEKLGGLDVLFIPVGGTYTLDAKKAVETISQIEPRIVIPMHYKIPGLKIDIDGVDKFIKELGLKPNYEEKLKLSKRDLPSEDMQLIILKN